MITSSSAGGRQLRSAFGGVVSGPQTPRLGPHTASPRHQSTETASRRFGIGSSPSGITAEKLARRDAATLTEPWHDDIDQVGHWRTSDGAEVDLVLETFDGDIVAFEVKAHQEASNRDASGLRILRDSLGDRFRAGFLLNTGPVAYRLDDRITVVPIDRLWHLVPRRK